MSKRIIIGLSVYQTIFGLFGVFISIKSLFTESFQPSLMDLIPFFLYGVSLLAAFELFFKHKVKFTIINQLIQLIQFKIGLSGFYFINGLYIGIGFNNTNRLEGILDFEWFEVTCLLHFNQEPEVYMVVINITSIVILGLVYFIEKSISSKESLSN